MKKFLIAVLLIIPILIIATLSLTGEIISYTLKNVQVDRVEITDVFNKTLDLSETFPMELVDGRLELRINTFPSIAYDHNVSLEKTSGSGDVKLEKISEKLYKIIPVKSGEVTVKIFSVTNTIASQKMNFYISNKKLGELNVFTDKGEYLQEEFSLEKETQFHLEAYPLESIYGKTVTYQTNDQNIANVDKNGKITPLSNGKCELKVSITDNSEQLFERTITINTEKAIVKSNHFYSSKELTIEEVKSLVAVKKDSEIIALGNNAFDIKALGITERVVGEIVDSQEWVIIDELKSVYMDNGGVFLNSEYLDILNNKAINPVYKISDSGIAEIVDNQLIFKKVGIAVLTAEVDGTKVSKEINVKRRPATYQLKYTEEDNKAGIKGERVWGINTFSSFENKTTIRGLDVGLNTNSVLPKDSTMDLLYEVTDENIASVNQKGLVLFNENAVGKTVTVNAYYIYNGIKTKTVKSYDIKILEDEGAYNVSTPEEAQYVYNSLNKSIALQKDLTLPVFESKNYQYLYGTANIYGNGYSVYSNGSIEKIIEIDLRRTDKSVVIDNIFMYNRTVDEYEKVHGGDVVKIIGYKEAMESGFLEQRKVTISYSYLAMAANAINTYQTMRLNIESSILSNLQSMGLVIMVHEKAESQFVFDKVVVKDSEAFTFGTIMNIESKKKGEGFPPVIFKNFVDSYSWCLRDGLANVIKMLDLNFLNEFIPGLNLGDAISKEVVSLLDDVFSKPQFSNMILQYKAKGDKETKNYYHMGGVYIGFYEKASEDMFFDETGDYKPIPFTLYPELKVKILGLTMTIKALEALIQKALSGTNMNLTLSEQSMLISYNFSENKPKFYPDDICPTNEELFERLRNNTAK